MRKLFIFMVILAIFVGTVCFADTTYEYDEDILNYLGESTGTELDDYDDIMSVRNGGDTQNELKEYYREFLKYSRDQDAVDGSTKAYKAKVIDVGETKTTYYMSYSASITATFPRVSGYLPPGSSIESVTVNVSLNTIASPISSKVPPNCS